MTIKKATKGQLRNLAQELVSPLIDELEERLEAREAERAKMLDAYSEQVRELGDLVAGVDQRVAQATALGQELQRGINDLWKENSRARMENLKRKDESEKGQEISTQFQQRLDRFAQQLADLQLGTGTLKKQAAGNQEQLQSQLELIQGILGKHRDRMTELEEVSIKNHSDAIKSLAERLGEAVVKTAQNG